MAAGEATNDPLWIQRAERLLRRAYTVAERYDGRVPEHYDQDWNPLLNFNIEAPNMPHYPYGFVIGHGMELARLAPHIQAVSREKGIHEQEKFLKMETEMYHLPPEDPTTFCQVLSRFSTGRVQTVGAEVASPASSTPWTSRATRC